MSDLSKYNGEDGKTVGIDGLLPCKECGNVPDFPDHFTSTHGTHLFKILCKCGRKIEVLAQHPSSASEVWNMNNKEDTV